VVEILFALLSSLCGIQQQIRIEVQGSQLWRKIEFNFRPRRFWVECEASTASRRLKPAIVSAMF